MNLCFNYWNQFVQQWLQKNSVAFSFTTSPSFFMTDTVNELGCGQSLILKIHLCQVRIERKNA